MQGAIWRTLSLVIGGPIFVAGTAAAMRNGGGIGLVGGFGLALVLLPFALRGLPPVEPQ
ncbi:MAG: hypothetical protein QOE45_130 [Frankiaceae bacterium]|jgi:hypothetical protein|nr:hypothetical protein [Frankiaceae bacterium]